MSNSPEYRIVPQIPIINNNDNQDEDIDLINNHNHNNNNNNHINQVYPSHPPRLDPITGKIVQPIQSYSNGYRPQYTSDGFAIPAPLPPKRYQNGFLTQQMRKSPSIGDGTNIGNRENLPQNVITAIHAASLVFFHYSFSLFV